MEANPGDLTGSLNELFMGDGMETARGPEVGAHPDGYVYWNEHYNQFGKIAFRVHPEILTGDESIVGVFQHEMFELAEFLEVFRASKKKRMSATDYGIQAATGFAGNFHDRAWASADEMVLRMREAKRSCPLLENR